MFMSVLNNSWSGTTFSDKIFVFASKQHSFYLVLFSEEILAETKAKAKESNM
jgi:hypothetical protein